MKYIIRQERSKKITEIKNDILDIRNIESIWIRKFEDRIEVITSNPVRISTAQDVTLVERDYVEDDEDEYEDDEDEGLSPQ